MVTGLLDKLANRAEEHNLMRIHFFQHVPFEGLGSIEPWITARGYPLTCTKLYHHEPFPDMDDLDWLIVMGGPMGLHDEDRLPWLAGEKRAIEQAIRKGKVVMGICLGAQLIANVLGARVYPNLEKEIGWFPIELTEAGQRSALFGFLPKRQEVFHWHGDTFDLPAGAVHLARSEVCTHQAFLYEERVLGLQFHLETTSQGVEDLIGNCANELVAGRYIQDPTKLRATPVAFSTINRTMQELLDRLETVAMQGS